jgi:hypothetical protein
MKKDIEYDITFTGYTIDTYQTFNTDMDEESIIESYSYDYGVEFTYDDFIWSFDHNGYVQALSKAWCKLMNENIIDEVILSVKLNGEAYSPREYNFSTDNCSTVFTVNHNALLKYIDDNRVAYDRDHVRDESGFMWFGDEDATMLHYYLHTVSRKLYDTESYMNDMFDLVHSYEYLDYELITR